MASRFIDIKKIRENVELDKTTRVFKGNGSPVLYIDGIKKITQVRIGSEIIPMEEKRRYMADSQGLVTEEVEPLLKLEMVDGRPALLRSTLSNHGIWQRNVRVYVSGEWDEPKKAAPKADPKNAPKSAPKTAPKAAAKADPVKGDDAKADDEGEA